MRIHVILACCGLIACGDDDGGNQNLQNNHNENDNTNDNANARCGDGAIDPGEDCDGEALGSATCETLGFTGGTLACADCAYDTRGCEGTSLCGNGVVDLPAEACDGTALAGATCASAGFTGGVLSCTGGCQLDTSACTTCGDGTCETGESSIGCPADCPGPRAIEAGAHHVCAIRSDDALFCWGDNEAGQLGDGTTENRETPQAVASGSPPDPLGGVVQVVAGSLHTCARLADGTVLCWGSNADGQLGDDTTSDRPTPTPVVGVGGAGLLSGVTHVSAGSNHTCATRDDGSVLCWGANEDGQLGDDTTTPRSAPVVVVDEGGTGDLGDIAAVDCGAGHTCALTTGGALRCWGRNREGQLGDGSTTARRLPAPVVGPGGVGLLEGILQVGAGSLHTCARSVAGTVQCWGDNLGAQLGDAQQHQDCAGRDCSPVPRAVSGEGGAGSLGDVASLAVGWSHTCAARTDGTAVCWGLSDVGQLGDDAAHQTCTIFTVTVECNDFPVGVDAMGGGGSLDGVVAVTAGQGHSCAILGSGTLTCWGLDRAGELGDGLMHEACDDPLGGSLECSLWPVATAPLP